MDAKRLEEYSHDTNSEKVFGSSSGRFITLESDSMKRPFRAQTKNGECFSRRDLCTSNGIADPPTVMRMSSPVGGLRGYERGTLEWSCNLTISLTQVMEEGKDLDPKII